MTDRRQAWVILGLTVWVSTMTLQSHCAHALPAQADSSSAGAGEHIETNADKLDYDRSSGWIKATGNVVIRKGSKELRADYVRINVKTEDAYAFGNVIFKRPGTVWTGKRLHYNFRTRMGDTGDFVSDTKPFHMISKKSQKVSGNMYVLHDAMITSCTNKHPHCHYHVRAGKVTVVPDEYLRARSVVWYFGRVPVMYIPYWYRDMEGDFGFRFYPGHNSRMGTFLLSSYKYRLNPVVSGRTHLDYRSKRGVAMGQDFKWFQAESRQSGDLSLYYLDDQEPVEENGDPEAADVDNERYRVRVRHTRDITDRDYLLLQAHYLSDVDILSDFFDDEYREGTQPDNYLLYTHRGDRFVGNALLQSRLNDFYTEVNRLPDISVDFMPQQMGNSPFYYEGRTAAAFLEKAYDDSATNKEDYSVFRIDSSHTVYRPSRHFGFLNLIPRAGYRGTYYSQTRETQTSIEVSHSLVTNIVVNAAGNTNAVERLASETNRVSAIVERGMDFRSAFELGLEASFKAFRTWNDAFIPLRHIVEPYADYTFAPEPTLLLETNYRMDEADELDEDHSVKIGLRNKLQSKRNEQPFDLVDVDVYAMCRVEPEEDESVLDGLFLDAELRPSRRLMIDLDSVYDFDESIVETFNTRVILTESNVWKADLEYRFRDDGTDGDSSSLFAGDLTLFPKRDWTYNVYARYEFEDSRLEEEGGYIQRNFGCMAVRMLVGLIPAYTTSTGIERDDEWTLMLEFWLTAFPKTVLSGRHRQTW